MSQLLIFHLATFVMLLRSLSYIIYFQVSLSSLKHFPGLLNYSLNIWYVLVIHIAKNKISKFFTKRNPIPHLDMSKAAICDCCDTVMWPQIEVSSL
jgi:hypothetical protein